MRGIVANIEYSGNVNTLSIERAGIDPLKLRHYLLYWDKIDYPSNNGVYTELSEDEMYLESIGLLKRTHTIFNGSFMINPEIFIISQVNALKVNSKNKGEIWTLAQPTSNIILPKNQCTQIKNIQVELYDCLPVPSQDVSIEEILEFKERRGNDLKEFRYLLDEMYDSIINNCDIDFAKDKCIERLQNKVIDINKIMSESKIKRFFSNVKIELNINELVSAGVKIFAGYEMGAKVGFPTIGTIVGLGSAAINLKSELSLKPNFIPDELKDYAYLFYANRELF